MKIQQVQTLKTQAQIDMASLKCINTVALIAFLINGIFSFYQILNKLWNSCLWKTLMRLHGERQNSYKTIPMHRIKSCKHLLLSCVFRQRERERSAERMSGREERGDKDNGSQLRKQLGLAQKTVICRHNNCSVGNTQPAKYSSAQSLLTPGNTEKNDSTGFLMIHHIHPCMNLASTTLKQSSKKKKKRENNNKNSDRSVGGNTSESSEVVASYCIKRWAIRT